MTALVSLVEEVAPALRGAISAIVIKDGSARVTYALWYESPPGTDDLVQIDMTQVPDEVAVHGRAKWSDTEHALPPHSLAVLESWIEDLRGSGLVGGLNVVRGHAGQLSIGTHWGSTEERKEWLSSLRGRPNDA